MQRVHAVSGSYRYDVIIESGLLGHLGETIKALFPIRRALLITDERLWDIRGEALAEAFARARIPSGALILKGGGYPATLDALREVSAAMDESDLGQSDALVALGGCTLLDTCGFAAWRHKSVLKLIQMPASLIGMTDWAVGGKTALEYKAGSKMIGSFFPPSAVLIDPDLAKTLPDRTFYAGMGEVIKTACAGDAALFRLLETLNGREDIQSRLEEISWLCLDVKNRLLERDPRLCLLGHGLAHAIEAAQRYRVLLHGEAVGVGTLALIRRLEAVGYAVDGTSRRVQDCLERYHLPTATLVDPEAMLSAIHALGDTSEALIERVGSGETRRVDNAFLVDAWFGGLAVSAMQ